MSSSNVTSVLGRPSTSFKVAGAGLLVVLGFFPVVSAVFGVGEEGGAATALWVAQMTVLAMTALAFVAGIGASVVRRRT